MTVQEFYDYCKENNCLDYELKATPGYYVFDIKLNPEPEGESSFTVKKRDEYKQICFTSSF